MIEYKLVIEWLEERNEVGLEEAQCTKLIPLLLHNPRKKQKSHLRCVTNFIKGLFKKPHIHL